MDIVYEAAAKFVALQLSEYRFTVSRKRRCIELKLNFKDEDFYHLAGFQHIKDVDIPKNSRTTLNNILIKKTINQGLLAKSSAYNNKLKDQNIESRIDNLRFLEEYLDTDNFIRIFTLTNQSYLNSLIEADYVIESKLKGFNDTVYIFLKQRREQPDYCGIVSFFARDKVSYYGDNLYWMRKVKITGNKEVVLYQHKNYNKESMQ